MAPITLPTIAPDELDDLIYYSRTGDLSSLQESTTTLSQTYSLPPSSIIHVAIDVDDEGLGSRACLLHYPAANGYLEIVQWILWQLDSDEQKDKSNDGTTNGTTFGGEMNGSSATTTISRSTPQAQKGAASHHAFLNHQNVSGNTALHWAGMNGHLEIVKALIHAGADPEIVNGAGRDAVVESEWSSKDGAAECAEWMLRECGGLEKGVGSVEEAGDEGQAGGDGEDEVMGDGDEPV